MKMSKEMKYMLIGAGVLVVGGIAVNQYKKSKVKSAIATTPGAMSNAVGKAAAGQVMVVGGYNAQTGQTYVFPEGQPGRGHYVNGTVNLPQGSTYTSN